MKKRLKFVSYDGSYPNLCSGTLVMELDGNKIIFPNHCLDSGGYIENWENCVEGEWTITKFPEGFPKELEKEAENIVNNNVPHGCCGGCI